MDVMTGRIAVLTGDVVASTDLSPSQLDEAFAAMREGLARTWGWPGVRIGFARYRGDGWQLAIAEARLALRVSLFLRACLKGANPAIETRLAIGVGSGAGADWDEIGASTGGAFTLSGRMLDGLPAHQLMDIVLAEEIAAPRGLLSALVGLCDAVSTAWTQKQAQVLAQELGSPQTTQKQISEALGLSQSTVAAHAKKGGHRAIMAAVGAFEAVDSWTSDGNRP